MRRSAGIADIATWAGFLYLAGWSMATHLEHIHHLLEA
jgi:hypothetical protein